MGDLQAHTHTNNNTQMRQAGNPHPHPYPYTHTHAHTYTQNRRHMGEGWHQGHSERRGECEAKHTNKSMTKHDTIKCYSQSVS